jgi:hypothetical protein
MTEARLEPSKQTAILTAFGDIARESKILPATSLDQAKYLLAQIVSKAVPGTPIDVLELDRYLRASGAPPDGVNEVVLALHRRVDNLGLKLRLPPAAAALPPEEQQRLADALLAKVAGARKGAVATGTIPPTASGVRAKPPEVGARPEEPKAAAAAPTERKLRPGLAVGLGAVALLAGGVFVLPLLEGDPAAAARKALTQPDPERYTCTSVAVGSGAVICKVEAAAVAPTPEEHRAKVAKTREAATAAGYKGRGSSTRRRAGRCRTSPPASP